MTKPKIGKRYVWRKHNRSGYLVSAKIVEVIEVNRNGTFAVSGLRNNVFQDRGLDSIPPYRKGSGALHELASETPETLADEIENSERERAALWARKKWARKSRL